MRFNLSGGGYTEVTFYRDKEGKTHPFPQYNSDMVLSRGTEESRKTLEKILVGGFLTFEDLEELAREMGCHVVYYAGGANVCRVWHKPVKSFEAVVTGLVYTEKNPEPEKPPKTCNL